MMNQLKNKIAVVTGVSRLDGIGAAICKELAEAGYDIFFTYWTAYDQEMPWGVDQSEQIQLKEELLKSGVKVSSMELDLTQNDAPKELINKVTEQLGYPHILINNAAYSTNNDFSNLTAEELDKHYMVNVRATTLSAEVAHLGITVNAINPGPTSTGWMTEEIKQGLKPMFPFGRIGEPKDAARLITFLVSEEAEWITGQVIHSEGGFKR
ncbi:SDR family oxidoreductase [Bacillus wiedmannii]|uniref:SDR family oxidoreductase n=1 Tax=Bacillus wiedmannii TaxID=1890302 RepID=UPI00115A19C7|nr:SDR family oxidoreductase [Bacillus wiedmannii]MBG9826541.1 3-ketoacyl-ACP reductase [Bacillus wiedmannii]UOB92943.1 short-chain dehydrogenase/reductase [Bacillus wiedmannii]